MCKYLLFILLSPWLVACGLLQSSRTCEEIASKDLRALVQEPRSAAEMRAYVGKIFGLQPERITEYPDEKQGGFSWSKNEVLGGLTTQKSTPIAATLNYRTRPPSAELVMQCLGAPDQYGAWYYYYPGTAQHTLLFAMYYSAQGIVAEMTRLETGKNPPYLDGTAPMVYFLFVPNNPPQETMKRLTEGLNPKFVPQIKPWPGKWEDVVIDIDPAIR